MISEDELTAFLKNQEEPFIAASDVAEAKGVAQNTALKHLKRLNERGKVNKKEIGPGAIIWWLDSRCD